MNANVRGWWNLLRLDIGRYAEQDGRALIQAGKSGLVIVIILWICMRIHLETPRSAMTTGVILMGGQQTGMVIARGFYRFVGMLLGAVVGIAIVTTSIQFPWVSIATLSLWTGVCIYGAVFRRNFEAYGYVLAGYSAAMTFLPVWSAPYAAYDNVIFLLSEVALGVVVAGLVSALIFPVNAAQELLRYSEYHCRNLLRFVDEETSAKEINAALEPTNFLLVEQRVAMENLRSAAVFEDPEMRLMNGLLVKINSDFLDVYGDIHALGKLLRRSVAISEPTSNAAVAELIERLRSVLPLPVTDMGLKQIEATRSRVAVLVDDLPGTIAALGKLWIKEGAPMPHVFAAMAGSVYFCAVDLLRYLDNFLSVRRPAGPTTRTSTSNRLGTLRALSTDNASVALSSALRAVFAINVMGGVWIASGWPGGAYSVMAAAIGSALFAIAPQPADAARNLLIGASLGSAAAFLFTFLLLPLLGTFSVLALSVGLVVATASYLSSFARITPIALGFNVYFCFIANLTNSSEYEPETMLDLIFAMLAGISSAWLAFATFVPSDSAWARARYVKQIRRIVSEEACLAPLNADTLIHFDSSVRDYISNLSAPSKQSNYAQKSALGWGVCALEIGRSVIHVRRIIALNPHEVPLDLALVINTWCNAIASHFRTPNTANYQSVLRACGQAMDATAHVGNGVPENHWLDGLRLRALIYETELTFLDKALPLYVPHSTDDR